jgi:SNF2 family DNA or RNA helicase
MEYTVGTPATNRPVELFSQLHGLLPTVFSDYEQFTKRYCDAKEAHYRKGAMDVRGASNSVELRMLLEGLVMIRRMKEDVLSELPDKSREMHDIHPDPCYVADLKKLDKEASKLADALRDVRNDSAAIKKIKTSQQVNMTNQYNTCGLAKIPDVIKYITELIKEAKEMQDASDTMELDGETLIDCIDEESGGMEEEAVKPTKSKGATKSRSSSSKVVNEEKWLEDDEDDFTVSPKRKRLEKSASKSTSKSRLNGSRVFDDDDDDDILFADNSLLVPSGSAKKKPEVVYIDDSDSDSTSHSTEESAAIAWKNILSGKNNSKNSSKNKKNSSKKRSRCLDHKIIVFAHHKAVMNALEDCFKDLRVLYIRVDGDVSTSKRDELIRKFQEDDDTDVALLSITSCGTGLNLTRANIAVFAELSWSLGSILQAEDRIHRYISVCTFSNSQWSL